MSKVPGNTPAGPSALAGHILARRPWLDARQFASFGFTSGRPANRIDERDRRIGRRLIAAYKAARARCPGEFRPDDVWQRFVDNHYGAMLKLIEQDRAEDLVAFLMALPRQGAGHGYCQGKEAFEALKADEQRRYERANWLLDHLVGFAEATGLLRTRCPEQGEWQHPPFNSADALRRDLEAQLGWPVTLPRLFDGMFALQPEEGAIHLRSLMPSYALYQLKGALKSLADLDLADCRIAEIGAGIAYAARLGAQIGMPHFSVFDLPEVNVAQGFFLLQSLDEDRVRLYGEQAGSSIEVLPAWEVGAPSAARDFDVVLNIDSFPEIDPRITREYLEQVARQTRFLYSINQEAPRDDSPYGRRPSVRELAAGVPAFEPVLRYPNWLRAGYVDELFRVR